MRGQVNPGEVLLKAVMFDQPKMLTGWNQKVSGQGSGLNVPCPPPSRHRPRGTTYPTRIRIRNVVIPSSSLFGGKAAREGRRQAGGQRRGEKAKAAL
jgi:hypothetical protein